MKKAILLTFCWAGMLPAMEPKKELGVYERAMALFKLTSAQKSAVIEAHNQANPLLRLPDEMLEHIARLLIDNVTRAQSKKELQEAVQAIIRLQSSCHRFNNLIKDDRYKKKLKENKEKANHALKSSKCQKKIQIDTPGPVEFQCSEPTDLIYDPWTREFTLV